MPLFRPVNEGVFAPTLHTTGPWRPDAQHGGPPAALLGRTIEAALEPHEVLTRINVELVRPIPLEPLATLVRRERLSRRVTHLHAALEHNGLVVATATALVLLGATLPPPAWEPEPDELVVPGPVMRIVAPVFASGDLPVTYHRDAVEHRMTRGAFERPGPATSWIRLLEPLVEGEATSSLCRLLAAADFGSGISGIYGPDAGVGLFNADLTVALARPPIGEWIRVAGTSRANSQGTGLAVSELGDEAGYVGVATQSLLGIDI